MLVIQGACFPFILHAISGDKHSYSELAIKSALSTLIVSAFFVSPFFYDTYRVYSAHISLEGETAFINHFRQNNPPSHAEIGDGVLSDISEEGDDELIESHTFDR